MDQINCYYLPYSAIKWNSAAAATLEHKIYR